jgi:hypothetical protein
VLIPKHFLPTTRVVQNFRCSCQNVYLTVGNLRVSAQISGFFHFLRTDFWETKSKLVGTFLFQVFSSSPPIVILSFKCITSVVVKTTLNGRFLPSVIALLMEAANTAETSVNFYQSTRRYKPSTSTALACEF